MNTTTRQIIVRIGRYAVIQFPRPGWRAQATAAPGSDLRLGRDGDKRGDRLVRGLGRTELVGTEQVGHDPQHPFHERAGVHDVSGRMSQRAGAVATNASMRRLVFTDFHPANVDSSPTPTFTVPSPTGNTHPYPGRWLPSRSRRSRWLSIQGSSWYGLSK